MGAGASGACCCCNDVNDYRKTARSIVKGMNLSGQTCIVTGATGALGPHVAAALFIAGATVVLASRSESKLAAVKDRLESELAEEGRGELLCVSLDLGDYDSIDAFVRTMEDKFPAGVEVLVNAAGLHPGREFKAGKYGHERSFQVNFLSAVALTEKMLPLMAKARNARIVNVNSLSHNDAPKPIDFDVIPRDAAHFGGYDVDYCEAKWLLAAYTQTLSARLERDYPSVKAVSADPGISPGESGMWDEQPLILRLCARGICACFTHTAPQAAGTLVFASTVDFEILRNGGYYTNCRFNEKGLPREDVVAEQSLDKTVELVNRLLPPVVSAIDRV